MMGVAGKPLTITGLVGLALLPDEICSLFDDAFSAAGQSYGLSTCTFTCLATMVGMLPPILVPPLIPFLMKNDDGFPAVRPSAEVTEM